MYGVIYLIWNMINGKKYVGQTIQPLETRFNNHAICNYAVGRAIRKYGKENFRYGIIKSCASKAEMDYWEKFFISALKTKSPVGYNCTNGGDGVLGRKHTDYEKAKISASKTGKHPSAETCAKIAATLKGRRLSSEHCKKISIAQTGEKNNNYGKHPARKTRLKMSGVKRNSPYKNLLNEMDTRQLTYASLAKILGLTLSAVAYKMRGKVRFTERDRVTLEEYFGKSADYLLS